MAWNCSDNIVCIDLHVHSKYSGDSLLTPEKIIKTAIKRGLDGVAITDHNTIRGGLEAKKYNKDLIIIVGAEIATDRGEIIGLFLNEEIKTREFWSVVDEIRAQDGIIVVPHPFDTMRKKVIKMDKSMYRAFDCVEVFNSRCIFSKFNEKALEFAKENGKTMTAGSDAHFGFEIGHAYTIFNGEIRKSLMNGKTEIEGHKTNVIVHGLTFVNKMRSRL